MADLKNRLSVCSDYQIDLRLHVLHFRLASENINEDVVKEDLERLKKLDFSKLSHYCSEDRNKFKLYFQQSRFIYYKYVIEISDQEKKIKVVTVHRINKKLQRKFEEYANR